jgi:hypothetical protein
MKSEVPCGDEDEENADGGGRQKNELHGVFNGRRRVPCLHDVVDQQRKRSADVHQADNPQNGVAGPGAQPDAHDYLPL